MGAYTNSIQVDEADRQVLDLCEWHVEQKGNTQYARGRVDGEFVYMHRLLTEAPDGIDVDHANGNGLDNRRGNLRLATRSQNQGNMRTRRGKRFKGVTFYKRTGKWMARIQHRHLGYFETEEEAAAAYNEAAAETWGEFARLNEVTV